MKIFVELFECSNCKRLGLAIDGEGGCNQSDCKGSTTTLQRSFYVELPSSVTDKIHKANKIGVPEGAYSCTIYGRTYYIPPRMMGGIERYIIEGIIPGQFLQAVICNDIKEAFGRADDENFHLMPAYINYFYNEAPAQCWGSKKHMENWSKIIKERRSKDAEEKPV